MRLWFFAFLGSLILLPSPLHAEEKGFISVKAEVNKGTITIGERIEYRITITHDAAAQILSPIEAPKEEPFEVKETHDIFEKQGKLTVEGKRFIVTAYELGEFILEPVTIQYRVTDGGPKTIQTNRLFVTVKSIDSSAKPKTDIRNVKGALGLKRHWGWLGWVLVFFITLGGGIYFWWFKKQHLQAGGGAEEPKLSPEDQALFELNRLFDSDLIRRGKMKEYFLEMSEVLRRYLERRFEISAIESTTSEILRDLKSKELTPSLCEKIQNVLESTDFVKFAKWKPGPPEIIRINQLAKALVEEARPKAVTADHGV